LIGLIGYNFCSDGNSADPTPTNINNITNTRLQNGIFDHFNVTRNVAFDYNSIIPTDWDIDTIMNVDFKGKASAGNVEQMTAGITSVRIKRRVKGTFDWITIKQIPVSKPEDLSFIVTDNLNAYNTEYEYAFVPVMEDVEGSYIIESILSKFEGVFVCDVDTVFKFHAGVEYNNNTSNQQVGVFQPYNRQYPVVVSNSIINYQTGTFGGWVLPDDFDDNRNPNRIAITKEKEALLKFLLNKKPKIIKDMNGNSWLVYFTGNPTLSYDNNYGQGMVKVSAEWIEVGDPNDKTDLYENGLIPTKR
jgi:hypothetical protein